MPPWDGRCDRKSKSVDVDRVAIELPETDNTLICLKMEVENPEIDSSCNDSGRDLQHISWFPGLMWEN